jgi:hypothetical protein
MATTTPRQFTGTPSLDGAKVAAIAQWYVEALGDEDKASEVELSVFYEGQRMAFESVLCLLYDVDSVVVKDQSDQMQGA